MQVNDDAAARARRTVRHDGARARGASGDHAGTRRRVIVVSLLAGLSVGLGARTVAAQTAPTTPASAAQANAATAAAQVVALQQLVALQALSYAASSAAAAPAPGGGAPARPANGAAPSPAPVDPSTYFTNGASLTSVPSDGPAAAYFTNGATVTSPSVETAPTAAPVARAPVPLAATAPSATAVAPAVPAAPTATGALALVPGAAVGVSPFGVTTTTGANVASAANNEEPAVGAPAEPSVDEAPGGAEPSGVTVTPAATVAENTQVPPARSDVTPEAPRLDAAQQEPAEASPHQGRATPVALLGGIAALFVVLAAFFHRRDRAASA